MYTEKNNISLFAIEEKEHVRYILRLDLLA